LNRIAGVVKCWKGADDTILIVIPKTARENLAIKPGDKFLVKYETKEKKITYELLEVEH